MSPRLVRSAIVLLGALLLAGCGGRPVPPPTAPPDLAPQPVTPPLPAVSVDIGERIWLPPHFRDDADRAHYYISRLPDRRFVSVYGGENPRPWYIAAEELGRLGELAVPLLVARLDSDDPYELMLALYALQLATQDPALMAATGGDYVQLAAALSEAHNAENRERALAWWSRHAWRWASSTR